jgi:hypothetical protein
VTATFSVPMLSVYGGRECKGFILSRGKVGFEAFNSDQQTLGIFPNEKEAADAISETNDDARSVWQ